jgi:hypothetical protein
MNTSKPTIECGIGRRARGADDASARLPGPAESDAGEPTPTRGDYDTSNALWSANDAVSWFHDYPLVHRLQQGGSCVSTCLSLLTQMEPELIRPWINTQNPVSWSQFLTPFGLKLAYCPTDFRRLRHYAAELADLDDLFLVSTYSSTDPLNIGAEPDADGWVTGSHVVALHRSQVYDTRHYTPCELSTYVDLDRYVKRLFRVVPVHHPRGL